MTTPGRSERCQTTQYPIRQYGATVTAPIARDAVAAITIVVTLAVGELLNVGLSAALPAYLYLALVGAAPTIADRTSRQLPNSIIVPSYVIAGLLLCVAALVDQQHDALVAAAVGGATLWVVYFTIAMARPRGLGFGDVKLAGLLGAYLGWPELIVGAFAGFLTGTVYAITLLATGRTTPRSRLAFGPWMRLGTAIGLAAGVPIWNTYMGALT